MLQHTVHIETNVLQTATWGKSEVLLSHVIFQEVRHQIFILKTGLNSRTVCFQHVVNKRDYKVVALQERYSGFPC
jgi:hypothetical protein